MQPFPPRPILTVPTPFAPTTRRPSTGAPGADRPLGEAFAAGGAAFGAGSAPGAVPGAAPVVTMASNRIQSDGLHPWS